MNHRRPILVVLFGVLVCGAAWLLYTSSPPSPAKSSPQNVEAANQVLAPAPLPALPTSPFSNTGDEAEYVGSSACVECHQEEADAYLATGMGRSLAEVTLAAEPPDAGFDHPLSGRRFEVTRAGGRLRHRETLAATSQVLADHAADFVVGSGKHSRSYLVEVDGFLVESPITWYASKQAWDMSPGYDRRIHAGFRREAPEKCLFCHAGRAVAIDESLHRIRFEEHAIGCERCHGPGSLHVERQRSGAADQEEANSIDHSIVNPAHLSRELADAVCQQCHLTTTAYVDARGRSPADFRPGLSLAHFRHYFHSDESASSMRVVGHVDQLLLSRCYQQSGSLSCTTCHNPHAFPSLEEREQVYRNICLSCHDVDSCSVSSDVRERQSPTNDCVACHMPSTPTDIPHMAYTNHRIGLPHGETNKEKPGAVELAPLLDLSFLPEADRNRSLGLAYFQLSTQTSGRREAAIYRSRAAALLSRAAQESLRDGEVAAALAQIVWPRDRNAATAYAAQALEARKLSAVSRVNSLYALAAANCEQQRHDEALPILRRLTALRRNAGDWLLIGDCLLVDNRLDEAIAAYEKAVQIDPNLTEIHETLDVCYDRADNPQAARAQRKLAAAIDEAMSE